MLKALPYLQTIVAMLLIIAISMEIYGKMTAKGCDCEEEKV
jgi:hypothetical protein